MNYVNSHTHITGYTPEELIKFMNIKQAYRANQIFNWISKGIDCFDKMTNISKKEQEYFKNNYDIYSTKIKKSIKDIDGTIKLQIETHDFHFIEAVLLVDDKNRKTACISSQIGCPLKCSFCKTGSIGFYRNLEANEIVEQFYHLEKVTGKIDNIVFMGMGEPLLNIESVKKSIEILTHPLGRNLSKRRITISTSGIIKEIYNLAKNGPLVRLAVSLTTANENLRKKLMPVTITNPLDELKKSLIFFYEKTNKRITLEFPLISKVNTDLKNAELLISFCENLPVHINLIPWNTIEELPYESPSKKEINIFSSFLINNNLNVTIRKKRGTFIKGACGQLGGK